VVTLKDIARKANVSVMTVSRVIKNSGYVNRDTRSRIEAVIEELEYRPNEIARSLVSNRTNNILLVVPDIENPFFCEMLKGTEKILRQHGFQSIFADTEGQIADEKEFGERALSRMVDGIIYYCPRADGAYLEQLSARIPMIVVDRRVQSEAVDQIYIDNKPGAMKAVEYLVQNGHQRIGLIEGPENVLANLRRKEGYVSALQKHRIPIDEGYIFSGDFGFENGQAAFSYFSRLPTPPTAYFATNDLMALGFIQQAQEHERSIPDDLSIIGFDNIAMSRLISPPLTTVNNPKHRMGALASYRLLAKLGESVEIPTYKLTNDLVVRASVAPLQ
jgi:DNA-binding LacI/PurR family transcriptional regulator